MSILFFYELLFIVFSFIADKAKQKSRFLSHAFYFFAFAKKGFLMVRDRTARSSMYIIEKTGFFACYEMPALLVFVFFPVCLFRLAKINQVLPAIFFPVFLLTFGIIHKN